MFRIVIFTLYRFFCSMSPLEFYLFLSKSRISVNKTSSLEGAGGAGAGLGASSFFLESFMISLTNINTQKASGKRKNSEATAFTFLRMSGKFLFRGVWDTGHPQRPPCERGLAKIYDF